MSVISVRKCSKGIEISSDSIATGGDGVIESCGAKFYHIKNVVLGLVGISGAIDYIRNAFEDNYCDTEKKFYEFMINIKKAMVEDEFLKESISVINVVVINDDVYTFSIEQLFLSKMGDPTAVGSGAIIAKAALKLGKTAKEACELAVELDAYCGGEIYTLMIPYETKKLK